MVTVPDLLTARLGTDGPRPLLTWYDDASGERVELSVATTANWVAKTANFLADERGIEPGDAIRLEPADHWLSAVVALAAWTAGACVHLGTAGTSVAMPGDPSAFIAAVLPQPDALLVPPPTEDVSALAAPHRLWTASELGAAAAEEAHAHGLDVGCRVLSTLALDTVVGLDAGLLLPLAARGSVVFVARPDLAQLGHRAQQERVTHTAGVTLDALPRLDA